VLIVSFLLALGIWQAMARPYGSSFHPALFQLDAGGDLQIDAALQLDQLSW